MSTTWEPGPGVVQLPDGRRVRGDSVRRERGDVPEPELSVLLASRTPPPPPWPHLWLRWPDFWLPSSTAEAVDILAEAYLRAGTERVEVACGGGVGRTGTALALLAVMGGVPAGGATAWVRVRYHPRAVETPWQRWWVGHAAGSLPGP